MVGWWQEITSDLQAECFPAHYRQKTCPDKESSIPDSHALEHLSTGVERKHGGAANTGTVQETQCQALHEGQRWRLGGAVIDNPRDGRLGQDGINADNMAVLQLQHARKEGLCRLEGEKNKE